MSNSGNHFISSRRLLTRRQTVTLLDSLETEKRQSGAITMYLKPGSEMPLLKKAPQPFPGNLELPGLHDTVSASTTGAVFFWTQEIKCILIPPFPIKLESTCTGVDTSHIRELLENNLKLGLIIVRLGEYAIGLFNGEKRLTCKVGTGLVHARHRQGGSSAHRFERHREKQMEAFFLRICSHVRELFESQGEDIDYLCFGGEHFTVRAFRDRCRFLRKFDDRVLGRLLDVRRPRQDTLDSAIVDLWSTHMVSWDRPTDEIRRPETLVL